MISLKSVLAVLAISTTSLASPFYASSTPTNDALKTSLVESLAGPPLGWEKDESIKFSKADSKITLRIHLVQQDMDKFHELAINVGTPLHILKYTSVFRLLSFFARSLFKTWLTVFQIATPGHALYGSHMPQHVIDAMIAPKDESTDLVMQWLESAGMSSEASLSPRLDTVVVESTIDKIENLLKAEYNAFGKTS